MTTLVALAGLMLAGCRAYDPGSAVVERRVVDLTLLADGSLQVREAFRVRAVGAPIDEFRWTASGDRVDVFFDTAAWLDGVPLDDDPADAARVSVSVDGNLDARWHFPAVSDRVIEIGLEYRAAGVIATSGASGMLAWTIAPVEPAYPVATTEVRFEVPAGAAFMEPPRLDGAAAWDVSVSPRGLTAVHDGIQPAEAAMLTARMAADTMALARPDWQFNRALAAELVPAFVSGGLFMVVVGVGILWMLSAWYPDPRRTPADFSRLDDEADGQLAMPSRLPPAFEVALGRRRQVRSRRTLAATAADLEARGVFQAADARAQSDLLPHERVLATEAWLAGSAGGEVTARLRGARRRFARALTDDLVAAGLVSAERVGVARGLVLSGLVVMAMGAACASVVPWLLWRYGPAPHAVPAGIILLGAMLFVAGERFVVLTPAGERARAGGRQ